MGEPPAHAAGVVGQERHPRRARTAPGPPARFTFRGGPSCPTVGRVPGHHDALTLSRLREEQTADLTLRNLMDALNLTYELRARYRVFEFEAAQEGAADCVALFAALCAAEGEQATALMRGLRARLAATEHAPDPKPAPEPTTARRPS
jgi:hypothetical protein